MSRMFSYNFVMQLFLRDKSEWTFYPVKKVFFNAKSRSGKEK